MANSLASSAASHGFEAKLDILDKATDASPKDIPVVVITSSYEGEPPDNASHFVSWLKDLQGGAANGVKYAVFGCGDRELNLSKSLYNNVDIAQVTGNIHTIKSPSSWTLPSPR